MGKTDEIQITCEDRIVKIEENLKEINKLISIFGKYIIETEKIKLYNNTMKLDIGNNLYNILLLTLAFGLLITAFNIIL